ncbi:uncharacterized protein LOC128283890 [Gossypium arboreum]|uniref:uncharacterized protein LOC128283890 n=1 Tax=Gossypium arboreum TaxID=29729 RepID=UPI0022F1C607|nr:uncharacterized protein LOC128283890 [Gossypium arboreum]
MSGLLSDCCKTGCAGESDEEPEYPYGMIVGTWKTDLINHTFPVDVAQKILRIPLAETPHEDFKVWMGEQSGDFSVRSAYKLLQDVRLDPNFYLIQTDLKDFYGKLWNLQLPAKIAITIWRIYWNYIPTLANLKHKRVSNDATCPRCGRGEEDITHIFRYCPATGEIWPLLDLSWISESTIQGFWEWITWVFRTSTSEQCKIYCCGMWFLWNSRNKFIHEQKIETGRELSLIVRNYIAELEGLRTKASTLKPSSSHRYQEGGTSVTIQFDTAFDCRNFKSTSGLVVWGRGGRLMATKTVLHRNVQSPFPAEALAGLQAVKLGSEMEFPSMTVMGDS